ncbi:hypothetical protein PUN28_017691 [Cardiocondyla obscurior]|uniref:Uncharacterized protein n=1 Tax=Cardiocondyla obscurior TaxID=286306 RepID=A0AAW2EPI0_9HYME
MRSNVLSTKHPLLSCPAYGRIDTPPEKIKKKKKEEKILLCRHVLDVIRFSFPTHLPSLATRRCRRVHLYKLAKIVGAVSAHIYYRKAALPSDNIYFYLATNINMLSRAWCNNHIQIMDDGASHKRSRELFSLPERRTRKDCRGKLPFIRGKHGAADKLLLHTRSERRCAKRTQHVPTVYEPRAVRCFVLLRPLQSSKVGFENLSSDIGNVQYLRYYMRKKNII